MGARPCLPHGRYSGINKYVSIPKYVSSFAYEYMQTMQEIMGWQGAIRVDGVTYSWMGAFPNMQGHVASVQDIQITPTQSIFYMTAGPMNLTVSYLSPVEVSDMYKHAYAAKCVLIYGCSPESAFRLGQTILPVRVCVC